MKNKDSIQRTSQNDRSHFPGILDKFYELVGENTPATGLNYRTAAREFFGVADTMLSRTLIDMERAGTLRRSYNKPGGRCSTRGGKVATWLLPLPRAEALRKQNEYWAAHPVGGPVPAKPAVKVGVDGEAHEAIAGPDAPQAFEVLRSERKDEGVALVEAARQYLGRQDTIRRAFQEMEKQGITVDWTRVDQVVSVEQDDRLESVANLLPYVTQLEKRVERLSTDNAELRERNKGIDTLTMENRKLREQNQRLLADKVGRSQTAAHV